MNALSLSWLRVRMRGTRPGASSLERCGPFRVRINDPTNFYLLCKDLFARGIYDFAAGRPDPRILDGGANIGMSVLRFKMLHPKARIVAFEPDPAILPLLEENLALNGLTDVEVVRAGLADREGTLPLLSDGICGSRLLAPGSACGTAVPCRRLRDYLTEPADFLKLNIEGAEWPVLADCADRLRAVSQMVVEYHHLPGLPRTLHDILRLLHEQGFEYLVDAFDSETNPGGRPPFRLPEDARYFLLLYARRRP